MVEIKSISFTDEYTGSSAPGTDYLMGSMGDKIKATIVVAVHWESMNTLVVIDTVTNTITRKDNVQWDDLGFKDGDTITIVGAGGGNDGDYTINKLQSSFGYGAPGNKKNIDQLSLVEPLVGSGSYTGVDIHGTTPQNSITHNFNLIPNDAPESYISLTDTDATQKKKATTGSVTWTVATTVNLSAATTSKGWDTSPTPGVDKVTKTAIINYAQIFTIEHTFTIGPLVLDGQQDRVWTLVVWNGHDKFDAPPPDYFADINCLKYIAKIESKAIDTDPKVVHVSNWFSSNNPYGLVSDKPGNTGWFDEFLNGGDPEYSVTSIAYVDNATSLPLSTIDIGKVVNVTATINSKSGNFSNKGAAPGSQVALNFFYLPPPSKYTNTPTDLLTNFRLDRKMVTLGGLAVDGENVGTDLQAFKNILATYVSNNVCTLTFQIDLSPATQTLFQSQNDGQVLFILMATPQKKSATQLSQTDRNAILLDSNNTAWDRDDATQLLWYTDTLFYEYPNTTTNPMTDAKLFITDTSIAKQQLKVKVGSELRSFSVRIQAYNSVTGSTFILEQYDYDFSALFGKNNEIVIPIENNRNFKLASTDAQNIISFERLGAIDDASYYGYAMAYAFKMRYEQWRFLSNYDKTFTQNPSEDWSQYSKATNWQVQFALVGQVYDPVADYTTEFIRTSNLTIKNDADSSDGLGGTIATSIKTFVFVGAAYVDALGFILNDDITHVVATFTGNFGSFPTGVDAYYGKLSLDVEDQGGINFVDEAATDTDLLTSSMWMAKPTLTVVNPTTITLEGDVDPTKLDLQQPRYLTYARLGYKKL